MLLISIIAEDLEFLARDDETAKRIHGKSMRAIQRGFDIPSNGVNDRLYGNACLYFMNCSLTICDLALRCYGSPKKIMFLVSPIKKAFSNLLDAAVDNAVAVQLNRSKSLEAYAIEQLELFKREKLRLVSYFRQVLAGLIEDLTYERIFETEGLEQYTALDLTKLFEEFDRGFDWYLPAPKDL